ncbi:acyltransferase family protein [Rothia sp. P6271]|uniref:acyltransferase family protein n=1 Tax=Rothia sp. P6271 TaxID=3402659 RepID=UPI003AD37580
MTYRTNLVSLTALRAPAAFFVFIYHIVHTTNWMRTNSFTSLGYIGVSLFFVLSGFVLTWSYTPERGYRDFYWRRFARVYPLHILFLCIALILPAVSINRDPIGLIPNIFLVQAWIPQWDIIFAFNGVSWSLSCEFFFYMLAPIIFTKIAYQGNEKKAGYLLISWYLLTSVLGSYISSLSNYADVVIYANPLFRSGEFALGIFLALFVMKMNYSSPSVIRLLVQNRNALGMFLVVILCLTLGIIYLLASYFSGGQSITSYLLAPVFALIIGAFAISDIVHQQQPDYRTSKITKLFAYLGEISFAFYLAHELVIVNLWALPWVQSHGGGGLRGLVLTLIALTLSIIVAMAAHHVVEKPLQRIITTWSRGKHSL